MCSAWVTALGLVRQAWVSDGIWGANAESEIGKVSAQVVATGTRLRGTNGRIRLREQARGCVALRKGRRGGQTREHQRAKADADLVTGATRPALDRETWLRGCLVSVSCQPALAWPMLGEAGGARAVTMRLYQHRHKHKHEHEHEQTKPRNHKYTVGVKDHPFPVSHNPPPRVPADRWLRIRSRGCMPLSK